MIVLWTVLVTRFAVGLGSSRRVIKQRERGVVPRFERVRDRVLGPGVAGPASAEAPTAASLCEPARVRAARVRQS